MAAEALPDRKYELIATSIVMTILCTFFVAWRLVVRFRINPRLWLSDHLMILAVVCLIKSFKLQLALSCTLGVRMLTHDQLLHTASNILSILAAYAGQGRLDADPFLTPERKRTAQHLLFGALVLNVYAMFLLKLSICALLMALDFSRGFRAIIWASVVVVFACNFIIPASNHFAQCRPISIRWDPRVKGKCWPTGVKEASAYTQASANIVTDFVYAASPIVYLRQVTLPKRTKWGLRIVFLCALG
jgi:hypothetical protein